jgi:uncharacterized protein (TIGR02246 family)
MSNDEQAIRDLISTWMRASAENDLQTVLRLLAEDVVFLVPGHPPMRGRDAFAASFKGLGKAHIEGKSEIQEVQVSGDWAYCWTQLTVTMTPPGGAPMRRTGPTLSILRKQPDGSWVMFRDANLLTVEPS